MTREEAIKRLREYSQYAYGVYHNEQKDEEAFNMAIEALKEKPVKRGEWRRMKRTNMWYKCSLCEWESAFAYHFCPDCGADMSRYER